MRNTTERLYFPFLFRLDGADRWLIWISDDRDGVWLDEDGSIPVFDSIERLLNQADRRGVSLEHDAAPVLHDLDDVAAWLRDPRTGTVDCVSFLNAWNLFSDVSSSIGAPFRWRDPKAHKIYDKLFWGTNLPAVTPEGRHYEPIWSPSDVVRLRQVLTRGFELFRSRIRIESESSR